MSVRIAICHYLNYAYDRPVLVSPQLFRLRPAAHSTTLIESYSLTVIPHQHLMHWQQDAFGNFLARVDFQQPIHEMAVTVDIVASISPGNPFDFIVESSAEHFPFVYDQQLKKDLSPYLDSTEHGPRLMQWLEKVNRSNQEIVEFLLMLTRMLHQDITYLIRMEPGVQTGEETLVKESGSCRDSAWLLVQILRHLGLASRFVSGYLIQLDLTDDQPETAKDTLSLHAWAEVYIPGAGWIGLDPTSGLLAAQSHIPLACTSVPESAATLTGTTEPCETVFTYTGTVKRLS